MLDFLFMLSDTPCKEGTGRYFDLLYKILDDILKDYYWDVIHVYKEYKDDVTKEDLEKYLQENLDLIEKEHPKVIIAFGREAFMALGLENIKVTEICSIPQKSPWFGATQIGVPKRGQPLQSSNRGILYTPKGKVFTLVSHKDILVYPTYSYKNMLSYGTGYKGQSFFQRQLERIKEIHHMYPNFAPISEDEYRTKITLYYKKEHLADAINILKELESQRTLSFDIETAGYDIPKEAQLNPRHVKAKISMIAFGKLERSWVFNTHYLPELIPYINKVLENGGNHLSWNGKFDIDFLRVLWKTNFGKHIHIDGMVCQYLVDMNMQFLGKGASTLKQASSIFIQDGARYAGYQKEGGIDEAIKEGDGAYLQEHEIRFMIYCGIDVIVTYKTVLTLWSSMTAKSRNLATTYYCSLSDILNEIHKDGIKVDMPKMELYMASLKEFIDKLEAQIKSLYDINPRSNPDLADVMYNKMGLTKNYTDAGNLSVTTEILESYKGNKFCALVSDFRSFSKQLELFQAILDHIKGGYCYPTYNFLRTTSGRLSSTKPPIHIVPKNKKVITVIPEGTTEETIESVIGRPVWINHKLGKNLKGESICTETSPNFKEIFVAEPGYEMIYSDYSQLEVNILANFIDKCSDDNTLQEAIRMGRDLHSYTASLLYSVIEQKEYTEAFIKANKETDPYMSWRQDAKSVLFKLIYGGTYRSFAEEKNIPDEDAKRIFDTFLTVIPGIADYMKHSEYMAKQYKFAETYPGHVRELPIYRFERNNNKAKNISLNHPIQGTACYFVNCALMELHDRIKAQFGGKSRILLTVHDSIASQFPEERWEEGLKLQMACKLDYVMERFKSFITVPLRMDIYHGKNWHELEKYKMK